MGVMSSRPGPILHTVLRAPRVLYDRGLGWLLGGRFVLVEHVGRKSGDTHRTVLEVIGSDRSTGAVVVMSGWGTSSDWYRNVLAAGHATVTIGRRTMPVDAFVLEDAEAALVLADYEERHRFLRPVVRLVLSRLAGFPYDGTDDGRRAVVRTLPLVRFTPLAGS